MTLRQAVHAGSISALVLFVALVFFLVTNQHSALAESTDIFGKFGQITQSLPEVPPLPETNPDLNNLAEEELCKIYTHLNEAGEPIPEFDAEGCGEEGASVHGGVRWVACGAAGEGQDIRGDRGFIERDGD